MNVAPFQPVGASQSLAVTATSQQMTGLGLSTNGSIRVVNDGTANIYLEIGTNPTAVVGTSMCMLPNTVEVFSFGGSDCVLAVIAAAALTNTIRVTPGQGQ